MSGSETERCPTCGSDDPRFYQVPLVGKRPQGAPLACPDPFHSPEADEQVVIPASQLREVVEWAYKVSAGLSAMAQRQHDLPDGDLTAELNEASSRGYTACADRLSALLEGTEDNDR